MATNEGDNEELFFCAPHWALFGGGDTVFAGITGSTPPSKICMCTHTFSLSDQNCDPKFPSREILYRHNDFFSAVFLGFSSKLHYFPPRNPNSRVYLFDH